MQTLNTGWGRIGIGAPLRELALDSTTLAWILTADLIILHLTAELITLHFNENEQPVPDSQSARTIE